MGLARDFTQVPAEDFQQLRSKFSIWFLLLAAKGLKLGHREYERFRLQEMVGAQHYENYSDFRRRVLEPAEKELREKASLYFDWKVAETRGRAPVTLDLGFHRNPEVVKKRKQLRKERPPLPFVPAGLAPGHVRRLLDCGISEATVTRLQKEETPEFLEWIAGKIEASKERRGNKDPIRDHERFSLAILDGERGNFRAEMAARKRQAEEDAKQRAQEEHQQSKKEEADQKAKAEEAAQREAWERFDRLRPNEKNEVLAAFDGYLREGANRGNPHLKRVLASYHASSTDEALVRKTLRAYMSQEK